MSVAVVKLRSEFMENNEKSANAASVIKHFAEKGTQPVVVMDEFNINLILECVKVGGFATIIDHNCPIVDIAKAISAENIFIIGNEDGLYTENFGKRFKIKEITYKKMLELIEKGENALDSKTVTEAEKAGIEITVMASDENKGTVVRNYISHG